MNQVINRSWGYLLLIASLTAISVATISPYNFILPNNSLGETVRDGFIFGSDIKDYWQNILLFVPCGFSLGMLLATRKSTPFQILLWSLGICWSISTTIELIQLFLPSRVSNFTDIIYNTIGGGLGGWLYLKAQSISRFLILAIAGNYRQLSYKSIIQGTVGYYVLIGLGVLMLLTNNNLNNWDENYDLALGNEVTRNRSWDGALQNLYISDRSFAPADVAQAFDNENFLQSETNLIAAITSDQQTTLIRDRQQTLPDLIWQTNSVTKPALQRRQANSQTTETKPINPHSPQYYASAIDLNRKHWLKTQTPATKLIKNLKQSDRFTIGLTVASHNLSQGGPARIMTISQNIFAQNIVIAQKQDRLYFRLRTPITGRNPVDPAFTIPKVFDDFDFHQIIITFQRGTLTFYIDRAENSYSYTFRPDVNFPIFTPWLNREWNVSLENYSVLPYQLLFYAIIFLHLVWVLTVIWVKQARSSN